MNRKIFVIIPVFNETKSIYELLSGFNSVFYNKSLPFSEIIVINDCSTDDSLQWIRSAKQEFKELNINIINHEHNKGLAHAFRTGFSSIADKIQKEDIIITLDGDNTHNPYLISDMLGKIRQGADIVIASRYLEQSRVHGLSKVREFLSKSAGFLYALSWNINGVRDYTCGFRAYSARVILLWMEHYKEKFIQENGFTVNAEILRKTSRFNPVFIEVPMILRYSNKYGASNMKVLKTIMQTLQAIWRYR